MKLEFWPWSGTGEYSKVVILMAKSEKGVKTLDSEGINLVKHLR